MNDLSLHILDIVQNSISAGASVIGLGVDEDTAADTLTITITDNGRGMTPEQVAKLSDPFFTTRTTRKVGMGIPLFRQSAEQSGGSLTVESEPGLGTTVKAVFGLTNIDRPPLGDVANALILTVSANEDRDFVFDFTRDGHGYRFDTVEVREALDGLPMSSPQIIRMLTEMVSENIAEIRAQSTI